MLYQICAQTFLILMFSSVTFGFYFVVDYFMDHGFPKIFGQSCEDSIQDDCAYINSHLNTFDNIDYRGHIRCKMQLDAGDQQNSSYKLKWLRFKVQATNCSNDDDYLEFHDGKMQNVTNATRIGRYCGWTYPTPNLTDALTQQYLTLVWRTNGYNEDKGWKVMATRVLPWPCPSDDYYHCKAENKCIDGRLKCDGIEQCDDGEDEGECSTWEKIIGGFLALGTAGVVSVTTVGLFLCIWVCVGARCIWKQCQEKAKDEVVQINVTAVPEKEPLAEDRPKTNVDSNVDPISRQKSAASLNSLWDSPPPTPEPITNAMTSEPSSMQKTTETNPWSTPKPPEIESKPDPQVEAHKAKVNHSFGMFRMMGSFKGGNKVIPK